MKVISLTPSSAIEAQHCSRIPYLRAQGVAEKDRDELNDLIAQWGEEHERRVLASFPGCTDLSSMAWDERVTQTKAALDRNDAVIYQPAFETEHPHGFRVRGAPDFLIRDHDRYVIRDCKLARRETKDREDFQLQLQIYGWLLEQCSGSPPARMEIQGGGNEIVDIGAFEPAVALDALRRAHDFALVTDEPYEPVGWSKCNKCSFNDHCWSRAVSVGETGIVPVLDQGMARALHDIGVDTVDQLLAKYPAPAALAAIKKPHGSAMQKIGDSRAVSILRNAEALKKNKPNNIARPDFTPTANAVMFDLEGFPPIRDGDENIYLWGTKVVGARPSKFHAALTDFSDHGEEHAWREFLATAGGIFAEYGDEIPFVHWSHYEKTHVTSCLNDYGDINGIGARVKSNLVDLYVIVPRAIALPVYSYGLKVIEKYLGFERSQTEYGGTWSMVQFIRASESEDPAFRDEIMKLILTYNEEDLDATAKVWEWVCKL